jgi:hypothetical protein
MLVGVVIMLVLRPTHGPFFGRKPEVADPAVLEGTGAPL